MRAGWGLLALVAALVVPVAALPMPAAGAATADAANGSVVHTKPAPYRVVALAGSPSYLVFARVPNTTKFAQLKPGPLYALGQHGKPQQIGRYDPNTDLVVSLSGDQLVIGYFADGCNQSLKYCDTDYWWNLTSGQRGHYPGSAGRFVKAAAPGGWLVQNAHYGLDSQTTSGHLVSLGTPFPPADDNSVASAAVSSSRAVVSDRSGDISALQFTHPGVIEHLNPRAPHSVSEAEQHCEAVVGVLAACATLRHENVLHSGVVELFNLTTGEATVAAHQCLVDGYPTAILGHDAIWPTCHGHLTSLTPGGHLTTSTRTYSMRQPPVSAFGRVIVADSSRQELLELRHVNAAPTVLVRAAR